MGVAAEEEEEAAEEAAAMVCLLACEEEGKEGKGLRMAAWSWSRTRQGGQTTLQHM
jgi:hypothetical protein